MAEVAYADLTIPESSTAIDGDAVVRVRTCVLNELLDRASGLYIRPSSGFETPAKTTSDGPTEKHGLIDFPKWINSANYENQTGFVGFISAFEPNVLLSWGRIDSSPRTSRYVYKVSTRRYIDSLTQNQTANVACQVAERLKQLQELAAEEGPRQNAMKHESLDGFLRFLQIHQRHVTRRPLLALTFEGHVRAEWKRNNQDRLAIEFLDDVDLRYVLFRPNSFFPAKTNRTSGSSTVETLFEDLGVADLTS